MRLRRYQLELCINIAQREFARRKPRRTFWHWTFIWQNGHLLEWATNRQEFAPYVRRFGYFFPRHTLHAEVVALQRAFGLLDRRKQWEAVNVRLLASGDLGLSKPCLRCRSLYRAHGCLGMYYTLSNAGTQTKNTAAFDFLVL